MHFSISSMTSSIIHIQASHFIHTLYSDCKVRIRTKTLTKHSQTPCLFNRYSNLLTLSGTGGRVCPRSLSQPLEIWPVKTTTCPSFPFKHSQLLERNYSSFVAWQGYCWFLQCFYRYRFRVICECILGGWFSQGSQWSAKGWSTGV